MVKKWGVTVKIASFLLVVVLLLGVGTTHMLAAEEGAMSLGASLAGPTSSQIINDRDMIMSTHPPDTPLMRSRMYRKLRLSSAAASPAPHHCGRGSR